MKKIFGVSFLIYILFFAFQQGVKADVISRTSEDESVYYIIIDRFYNGDQSNDYEVNTQDPHAYHGGDLKGIMKRINHIKEMGFTVIQLSPVFESKDNSYLSEDIQDYYKINPQFGNLDNFKELVNVAHEHQITIILDLPMTEVTFTELSDVAKWWVNETGVDGFYLEKHPGIPLEDYESFAREVKKVDEGINIIINSGDKTIHSEHSAIDYFINNDLSERMRAVFVQPDQSLKPLFIDFERENQTEAFWKYIDNKEITRFTYEIVEQNQFPGDRWPLVLTYMYTTPGVPVVLYGSEIALNGGEGAENHRLMDFRADDELIEFMEKLGKIRNHYPSLTKGDIKLLYDEDGMTVYSRTYGDETTVIAINNTSQYQMIEISSEQLEENKQLSGLLEGELIKEQAGKYIIQLNQEQAEIFIVQNKTGINMVNTMVMSLIPIVFILFYYFLWRKGKKKIINE